MGYLTLIEQAIRQILIVLHGRSKGGCVLWTNLINITYRNITIFLFISSDNRHWVSKMISSTSNFSDKSGFVLIIRIKTC